MTPHWTSTLPPGWKVEKLKYLAEVRLSNADKKSVDGEQSVRLCNYVNVYKNDFITPTIPFMEATASDSQIRELALRAGDVLITKDSEEWNDIAVPALVPADLPGVICGYHLAHIRPDPAKVFGGYLFRAFAAQGIADQFKVAANGITRYGISKDDIASALFPMPSLPEQHAIAEFLDRKTAEIDAVVTRKQRIIGLLRDERQALINRVVIRGLDDSVAVKESGIAWLGKVPVHWMLCQLKRAFASVEYGISDSLTKEGNVPVLRMGNIQEGRVVLDDLAYAETVPDNMLLAKYDLLFNRTNSLEQIAKVGLFLGEQADRVAFASYLVRLRVNSKADPRYLNYLLNTPGFLGLARSLALPSIGQANLNPTRYGEMGIALPPLLEQRLMSDHLDRETARLDGLIDKNEQQIAKLREYRHALISAAVTGKIAVTQQPTVVVPVEPAKKPNPYFRRTVFAAEIINQLHDDSTFGHVKFQKVFFVAQHHLRLGEFEENYHRMQAGPHDNQMIRSLDSQLSKQKWFAANQTGERYVYEKLEKAGQHKKYFDGWFGTNAPALGELLAIFRPMTTAQAEIVATLYAAWNDFLLLGEPFDDDRIIDDVLNNWHESKQKIPREKWKAALDWMRTKKLVPSGFGKPTRTANANSSTSATAEEDTAAGNESK